MEKPITLRNPQCSVKQCPYHGRGDVFHLHTNALYVARDVNRLTGYKAVRVAVIDSHFHIVPTRSRLTVSRNRATN